MGTGRNSVGLFESVACISSPNAHVCIAAVRQDTAAAGLVTFLVAAATGCIRRSSLALFCFSGSVRTVFLARVPETFFLIFLQTGAFDLERILFGISLVDELLNIGQRFTFSMKVQRQD